MNDIRRKAIEFEAKMYGVATNPFVDGFVNGYQQGKADQKKEDNEFFNFDKVVEIEKSKSYQQGAREFAKWLCKGVVPQDNPHITYSVREMLNDGSSYEVEAEDLLAEWQKGGRE